MSRLSGQHHRPMTADAVMSNSFHGSSISSPSHNDSLHNHSSHLLDMTKSLIENFTSDTLMTQSLDPTILASSSMNSSMNNSMTSSMIMRDSHPSPTHNGNLYNEQSHIPVLHSSSGPLVTASKMMPVPESLMSPDCGPSSVIPTSQQQTRPLSGLTTNTSNTTTTTVRTTKIVQQQQQQQQRPSSSPATNKASTRIATKKSDKLSPSNSPRKALKAMMNTANTKIHQNQSILKNSAHHQLQQQQQQQEEFNPQNKTAMSSVATTEDEDEDECDKVNEEKLKSIKKVAQKNQKQMENQINKASVENKEAEKSAILIQKIWRGYNTRKQNNGDIANALQQKRTNEYILKLAQDMEMTKQALENERKIQQLQMQAINALWKKVSSMQVDNAAVVTSTSENGGMGDSANSNIVHDLTKTCSVLTNQVPT